MVRHSDTENENGDTEDEKDASAVIQTRRSVTGELLL
jgi:hypothetical protein